MERSIRDCLRSPWARGLLTAICVLVFVVVFFGMRGVLEWRSAGKCLDQYPLINPLFSCSKEGEEIFVPEYELFQERMERWISEQKASGIIVEAGVYFRDLRGGPWFGINERQGFFAASLFKVPVMMAVYRYALRDPGILDEEFSIAEPPDASKMNVVNPSETLEPGKAYGVRELLEKMIVYSDNISLDVLHTRLSLIDPNGEVESSIYRELGVLGTETGGLISPKQYSAVFRVLFNGRFLGREYSEQALQLLAKAQFRQALSAGVPEGVTVAHKFGVRDESDPVKSFHDCGIVYHPVRPYMLCVMTRSRNVESGIEFIRDLSEQVFREVDRRTRHSTGSLL